MTCKRPLLILLFILAALGLHAQTLESLRDEIEQAENEIRITNTLLSKTKKDQKTTDGQLKLIRTKINSRKNIIASLEKQTDLISNDIGQKNGTIQSLSGQLAQLRKEYGGMVRSAYNNYKLNNFMVFLFSSKDFNDATRRIAYMRRYNRMRQRKAAEIDSVAASINVQVTDLQGKKEELDKVYKSRNDELASLGKDEGQFKTAADKLRSDAGKLNSEIKENQNKINRLQQQIRRMITEDSRKNNARPRTAEQQEYIAKLSGEFGQNRGKLPYPVRGVIVSRYGVHAHTAVKGVVENNPGVNIASDPGADVRSVFEGEVSQVFLVPGMSTGVMIRHGNYLTVYCNLEAVSVKAGDKVSLNQTIGRLSSSDNDNTYLHFEIWQEMQNLNPEPWLRR